MVDSFQATSSFGSFSVFPIVDTIYTQMLNAGSPVPMRSFADQKAERDRKHPGYGLPGFETRNSFMSNVVRPMFEVLDDHDDCCCEDDCYCGFEPAHDTAHISLFGASWEAWRDEYADLGIPIEWHPEYVF